MARKILAAGVGAIAVIAAGAIAAPRGGHTIAAAQPPAPTLAPPAQPLGELLPVTAENSVPPGVAFIPRAIGSVRGASAAESPFSAADVTAYLNSHPLFQPAAPGAGMVSRALLLPAGTVSRILAGESIGRTDSTPVWYVEFRGPVKIPLFSLPGPNMQTVAIPGVSTPATTYLNPDDLTVPVGIAVFDAQTGNLLLSN